MLTFKLAKGHRLSLRYSDLKAAELENNSLLLGFSDHAILIEGANLNPIHFALTTQQITFLKATPSGEENRPHIKNIELLPRNEREKQANTKKQNGDKKCMKT